MCVNYLPIPKRTVLERFHAAPPAEDWREEVWQDYAAPILIGGDLARQCVLANYGFCRNGICRQALQVGQNPFKHARDIVECAKKSGDAVLIANVECILKGFAFQLRA